jgi:hypothetical protein
MPNSTFQTICHSSLPFFNNIPGLGARHTSCARSLAPRSGTSGACFQAVPPAPLSSQAIRQHRRPQPYWPTLDNNPDSKVLRRLRKAFAGRVERCADVVLSELNRETSSVLSVMKCTVGFGRSLGHQGFRVWPKFKNPKLSFGHRHTDWHNGSRGLCSLCNRFTMHRLGTHKVTFRLRVTFFPSRFFR